MLQSFAKSSFRELLERASKTQPTSNIRPLHSLDSLARAALDSTPTVVNLECQCDRLKKAYQDAKAEAEAYLETLKTEFEAEITKAEVALAKAEQDRRVAQYRTIRQLVDLGVFNGVKSLDELVRNKDLKEAANGTD